MKSRPATMTIRPMLVAITVADTSIGSSALTAQATDPLYEVVEIPNLPGHPFPPTARMNNHGHAVGGNWTCPYILSCLGRGFLYDGTHTHDFTAELIDSLPQGLFGVTRGVDINDAGDVLLWLTIVDVGVFPHLWRDGEELIDIEGPPGAVNTVGLALNGSGMVVGYYSRHADTRAFVWTADDGVIEVIEPAPGFASSAVQGVNDAGDVVGIFSDGIGPNRGFVRSDGTMTVLEPLPGDVASVAVDINESGLVCGESIDANGNESLVLWRDGVIVDSVTLQFERVLLEVQQVSENGVVVGSYWPLYDAPQPFAFAWSETSGFQHLDALDLSIPDLNLWQATGVNASGQIVAWGEYPGFIADSFLLTPVSSSVGVQDFLILLANWG